MTEEKRRITTGFLAADLFHSWHEPPNIAIYDERESAQTYASLCQTAIEEEYPNTEVEVLYEFGAGGVLPHHLKTRINGASAAEASSKEMFVIAAVDDICGRVYQQYEWCVIRDEQVTLAEATDLFDIPPSTLRYHAARGNLPAVKKAKTWLVNIRDLHKWISARERSKP